MPICMIWYLHTIFQSISTFCCRKRNLRYSLISIIIMNIRILPDITN